LLDFVGNNILLKLQLHGLNKKKKIKKEEKRAAIASLVGPPGKKTRKREGGSRPHTQ